MTMLGKKHNQISIEKMKITKQKTRMLKQPQKNIKIWFSNLNQRRLMGRDGKGRFVKGNNHPMKSEIFREKVSRSLKGMIAWNKGLTGLQKQSEYTKKKRSNSMIGKNLGEKNGNYGKPSFWRNKTLSEEHKDKLKLARRHRVIPKKDTKPERMMQIALSLHGIRFETHKPILGQPDIFIEPNLCVFIDGDFFHANPEKYSADTKIIHGRYAKDIWAKDIQILHQLSEMGYRVMRIWESKIKVDANICAENIIKMIKISKGLT